VVAAIVVLGLVATGVVAWLGGAFTPPDTPPSANPVPTEPVTVDGGDVGQAVELRAAGGTAQVIATLAEWSLTGELAPTPGMAYLVVDVEFTGTGGAVAVGPMMAVAEAADQSRYPVSYGPLMPELPPGALLHEGDTAQGSFGFMLPPGETTIVFLDVDGEPMGSVRVPGP
jgi:hypothetical protein